MQSAVFVFLCVVTLAVGQQCPRDGGIYNDAFSLCYYFFPKSVTYNVAQATCKAIDGNGKLVCIHSGFQESYIIALSIEHFGSNDYWIGLNDLRKVGTWEWQDGVSSAYTNWAGGFPMSVTNMYCAGSAVRTGKWYNALCQETSLYFICQTQPLGDNSTSGPPATTTTSATTTTTTTTQATAPPVTTTTAGGPTQPQTPPPTAADGWVYYGPTNSWYKLMSGFASFDDSESDCVSQSAHLVSIHSAGEDDFVKGLCGSNDKIWIGLKSSSATPFSFAWTDGTPVDYNDWNSGYPKGSGLCATLESDNGEWENFDCGYYNSYVCKKTA